MKAKVYAKVFLSSDKEMDKAIYDILMAFLHETMELTEARHSNSDECLIGAMKEQCQKWVAFARIVNEQVDDLIAEDGLKNWLYAEFPRVRGRL